ncbi:ObirOr5-9E87 [Ooceraea biroi]|uniref:Odorant receptor n=1 Tax=Ooceraea biroi TaxID=2015173 RepID=A0A3L8E1N3_OOCBI|nr:odorant receptor 13a [Ooceraea biroi]RLU25938.1 ObirOr5-9E87 [Ooceraea biroi]
MDTQFLYIHRLSLAAIGLWPYHRTMLVQLQSSVFSLTMISYLIFQLTTLLTTEWTIDFIVEILSTSLFVLLCTILYNSCWINTHVVKRVLDNLQYICSDLKDENEIAIIKRYGYIAKCVAVAYTLLTIGGFFSLSLLPILPRIFGIFSLVNKSELHHNIYMRTEYFVDQEKYFYFILLHLYAVQYIGGGILLGESIVMVGYGTYSCGLFNIASYRIEQAMRISSDEVTNRKNKKEIDRKISHAVNIHRTALEFITFFLHSFEGTYFVLIAIIVISLSLNLFGIFQAVCLSKMENCVLHFSFALGLLTCSLGANYIGQAITDHYTYIFSTAYNVRWYIAPVRVQRLLLFLMQKGAKPYSIKLGGLCTLSLENFASLSSVSLSYFTIICSIQK